MPTVVSLVSEQTIPNVAFIKQMKSKANSFLFITTTEFENRVDWITKSAFLDPNTYEVKKLFVYPNGYSDILSQLHGQLNQEEEYIVNITCGTKLMSLAVFEFFKNLPHASIFYLPISQNKYIQLHPVHEEYQFKIHLSLQEYLTAYGLIYDQAERPAYASKHRPDAMMSQIRDEKGRLPNNKGIIDNPSLSAEEKKYLTGGWFEWYAYDLIKQEFNLHDKFIACGVHLKRDISDRNSSIGEVVLNEMDVMFVKSNILYLIECKVVQDISSILHGPVDRLTAISTYLSTGTKKYIFVLSKFTDSNQAEIYRSKMLQYGIHDLVTWSKLKDEQNLRDFIRKM